MARWRKRKLAHNMNDQLDVVYDLFDDTGKFCYMLFRYKKTENHYRLIRMEETMTAEIVSLAQAEEILAHPDELLMEYIL